jgi:hypothetical protein
MLKLDVMFVRVVEFEYERWIPSSLELDVMFVRMLEFEE